MERRLFDESIAVVTKDRVVDFLYRINPVYVYKQGILNFQGIAMVEKGLRYTYEGTRIRRHFQSFTLSSFDSSHSH